ncbi:MAG: hypothetical protein AAF360_08955 [Pseudomonadota bacterium]
MIRPIHAILFCALLTTKVGYASAAEAKHLEPPSETSAAEAKHRIALADQQMALIEEMSEAACMAASGLEVADHIALIKKVRARYEQVRAGLLTGDPEIGLTGEEHASRVLKAMARADKRWLVFADALDNISENGALADDYATVLFDDDVLLLKDLKRVLTEVEAAHTNPAEVLYANAFLIELAARQEVLIEAIAKDVCLVNFGWKVEKHLESLQVSLTQFDTTNSALINGMPAVGVKPAPTPEIKAALDAIVVKWAGLKPLVDATQAGEKIGDEAMLMFDRTCLELLHDFELVVKMYEAL